MSDTNVLQLIVNEKCNACGVCFDTTSIIIESEDGRAKVRGKGIVPLEEIEVCEKLIKECPVGAIETKIHKLSVKEIEERIKVLKKKITDLKDITPVYPDYESYKIVMEDYKNQIYYNGLRNVTSYYDYPSKNSALSAAERYFKANYYSQLKVITQQILVNYKNTKLKKFVYFEEKEGNYYYDLVLSYEKVLEECMDELSFIFEKKLNLTEDIIKFNRKEISEYMNEMSTLNLLEETWVTKHVENDAESLSWYAGFFDYDDHEEYAGEGLFGKAKMVTKYKYDMEDAAKKFQQYTFDDIKSVVSNEVPRIINEDIESKYKHFFHKVLTEKVDFIIKEIEKIEAKY